MDAGVCGLEAGEHTDDRRSCFAHAAGINEATKGNRTRPSETNPGEDSHRLGTNQVQQRRTFRRNVPTERKRSERNRTLTAFSVCVARGKKARQFPHITPGTGYGGALCPRRTARSLVAVARR